MCSVLCSVPTPLQVSGFVFYLIGKEVEVQTYMSCVVSYMEDKQSCTLAEFTSVSFCFSLLPPLVATHWAYSRTEVGRVSHCFTLGGENRGHSGH